MFGTILTSVITLMHIYVFWRAASVPFLKSHAPQKILFGVGIILWLGFYLGRVFGHGGTGTLAMILELIGMNWMAMLFLIFVCLLTMDFITGFGFLLPRLAPSLRGLAIVTGIMLSVIALIQGLRPPVVENYDVYLFDLPNEMENTVLIAMSDLHLGSLLGERWLEARITQVQEEKPDLVVLLGDIFEGHGESQDKLLSVINRLTAPLGVWAVYGNHGFHRRHNTNTTLVNKTSFKILRNRWTEVRSGLILTGLDDLTSMRRSGENVDLISKALTGRPPGATILLSHTPWEAEKAANAGVGLMLSGHTHGGQIWPFDYLVKRRYPLLEGRYEVNGMTVIVSRGTGTWGPRMRLWSPGEILRVTLHGEKDAQQHQKGP
jgi:predicted MPP superfamily phosphohydrolase